MQPTTEFSTYLLPGGGGKKIATDNRAATNSTFWEIEIRDSRLTIMILQFNLKLYYYKDLEVTL